jgi:hypothetical protein
MEVLQARIVAYLRNTRYPKRRQLDVVASILGVSISAITPAVDALERAGRLRVTCRKGSLVLEIPRRAAIVRRLPVAISAPRGTGDLYAQRLAEPVLAVIEQLD